MIQGQGEQQQLSKYIAAFIWLDNFVHNSQILPSETLNSFCWLRWCVRVKGVKLVLIPLTTGTHWLSWTFEKSQPSYSNNDIQDNKMWPTLRLIGAAFINSFCQLHCRCGSTWGGITFGIRRNTFTGENEVFMELCPVTCRQLYNYLIQYLEYFSCNECLEMFSMEI